MSEKYAVLGHLCDGLRRLNSRMNGTDEEPAYPCVCIPIVNVIGQLQGCDDTNYCTIKFCPMCGVKLENKEISNE